MPVDLKALAEQRKAALDEAQGIIAKAETEKRELSADEETRFGELTAKVKSLDNQSGRAALLEQLRGAPPSPAPVPGSAAAGATGSAGAPEGRFSMPTIPAAPEQPHRRYSILRAMRLAADHRPLDGYEGEVNQELAKRNGRGAHGFWMPHSFSDPLGVEAAKRGLPPGMIEFRAPSMTAATGAGAIPLIVDPTNFIELLRNKAKVRQMGCKILTDLVGDLALPKQTGPGSAYWFNNENAAPNVSNQTTTQVAFYPKTIGAFTDISRAFIKQSCLDAEMFVREDLALVMALGLDLAAINGSGQGATPLGLLQNANVPTVPIATNGGNLTWDAVVTLESSITALNADIGEMQYLMNAPTRGDCKVIPKIGSTYPIFLMEPNGDMNGYKTQMSNQMPANLTKGIGTGLSAMLFGAWSQLIMAFWSGLDVLVDVYTGGTSGVIRIVMLQDADIQVRHPESFAKIVDIVTIT